MCWPSLHGYPGSGPFCVAWSFAAVLFVDKNLPALEALRESNRLTYGNKWRIFGAEFLVALCLSILTGIISLIFGVGEIGWLETIGAIINLVVIVFAVPAIYGVEASIYKQLTTGEFLEAPAPAAAPEASDAPAPAAPAAELKPEKVEKKAPAKKAPKVE